MTGVLIQRGNFGHRERHAHRTDGVKTWGGHHVRTEDRSDEPTSQGTPAATRVNIEAWNTSFPSTFKGSVARSTPWVWTSGLRNWRTIKFCGSKPLSLWYVVTAATGNEYNIVIHKRCCAGCCGKEEKIHKYGIHVEKKNRQTPGSVELGKHYEDDKTICNKVQTLPP